MDDEHHIIIRIYLYFHDLVMKMDKNIKNIYIFTLNQPLWLFKTNSVISILYDC